MHQLDVQGIPVPKCHKCIFQVSQSSCWLVTWRRLQRNSADGHLHYCLPQKHCPCIKKCHQGCITLNLRAFGRFVQHFSTQRASWGLQVRQMVLQWRFGAHYLGLPSCALVWMRILYLEEQSWIVRRQFLVLCRPKAATFGDPGIHFPFKHRVVNIARQTHHSSGGSDK